MTPQEAKKMLEAKLKCLIAETSGTNHDCNMRLCDGCPLNYEQGNMGEQKQALDMAIKALEQTELNPSYNSVKPELDCISREAVEKITWEEPSYTDALNVLTEVREKVRALPSVTPKAEALKQTRPKGKWKYTGMGWFVVCNCSECGFQIDADEANNFCPYCGADMRESEDKK